MYFVNYRNYRNEITEICSAFLMLHNEKRAVHNITVYCEERYAERKNKEKSCYTDFQETDFRVLAQGGQRNDEN